MTDIGEKIFITFQSERSSKLTLELKDGKGVIVYCGVYRFDQSDDINDIVSDAPLLLIPQALGNILFTVIEDWLE